MNMVDERSIMVSRNLMEDSMMHMDRTLPRARWLNRLTGICQVPDCCTKGWYRFRTSTYV